MISLNAGKVTGFRSQKSPTKEILKNLFHCQRVHRLMHRNLFNGSILRVIFVPFQGLHSPVIYVPLSHFRSKESQCIYITYIICDWILEKQSKSHIRSFEINGFKELKPA